MSSIPSSNNASTTFDDPTLPVKKSTTPSTRTNSSGALDFDKPNLKHLSTSDLEVDESVVRAEGEERTTAFVWWLVIAAATGGLLFGYDVSRFEMTNDFFSKTHHVLVFTDWCYRWSPRSPRYRIRFRSYRSL
jgi:hypothetical protein